MSLFYPQVTHQIGGNTDGVTAVISSGTMTLAGGNNITLSQAGNAVTISAGNATQTVPPIGTAVNEVASAGSTGTITRFAPEDHAHRGLNLFQISGNTSNTSNLVYGSLYLAGGNNVTLSQVSGVGAATVTISAANETQTVPPIGTDVKDVGSAGSTGTITRFAPEDHAHRGLNQFQITGNTSNTSNLVYGSLYLAGGNNITLSQVSGAGAATVTISAGAGGGAVVSNAIQTVGSVTGSGTNTSRFAADDHVHAGLWRISVGGNTSGGNTSQGQGSFMLAGGPNITLSGATAVGGMTLSVSANEATNSYFANLGGAVGNSSAFVAASGSTSYVQPFFLPYPMSVSYLRFPVTLSIPGSMAAVATANNVTRGMTMSSTWNAVVYSLGVGANSRSLQSVASGSASWVQLATVQAAGVGSNWSSGHTVSFPREGGNTNQSSGGTSGGATSASFTHQSSQLSDFTGLRFLDIPFENSLSAGAYWLAFGSSSSLSTSGTANISTLRILLSQMVATQPNQNIQLLGSASNSSNAFWLGLGSWSTNVMQTTASIALANISSSASHPQYYFQMIRQA